MDPTTQVVLAFSFGIVFVITLIVLAIKFPHPSPFQYNIFRTTSSLAAAGVAAMIPGFIDIKVDATTGRLLRAGGAMAVFVVTFFFNPARLAARNESEVPPFRLPSGALLPKAMHTAFIEVWQALSDLQSAGNSLWRNVSDSTLSQFADKLREAEDLVGRHALFFSDTEYEALLECLEAANFYLGGKSHLAQIRGGTYSGDAIIKLSGPGRPNRFVNQEVKRVIAENRCWLDRYVQQLTDIRSRFHKATHAALEPR